MLIDQDQIGSTVISDQTIIKAKKITISGLITVEASAKLDIEGSELYFTKGSAIVCHGTLKCSDTNFTAKSPAEAWGGIFLSGNGAAGSSFSKCTFKNTTCEDSEEKSGGAITINQIEAKPVRIKNCNFADNHGNFGGGICVHGILSPEEKKSPPVSTIIENCQFSSCNAINGGAIGLIHRAVAEVKQCSFNDCSAKSGGAVYLYDYSEFKATECSFENCSAEIAGGAITSRFSTFTSNRSSIKKCSGSRKDTQGGAYYLEKSNTKLSSDKFLDCLAESGGALRPVGGLLKLDRCEFKTCTAYVAGGAIAFSRDCESEINGCRFSNCSKQSPTGKGNSIAFMDSSASIKRSVFAECKSSNIAEEISYGPDSSVQIENCELPQKSVLERIISLFHSD